MLYSRNLASLQDPHLSAKHSVVELTRKVTVDEQEFEVKAWTVSDRKQFLTYLDGINKLQPSEQYDKVIEFIAKQLGKKLTEVEQMDAVLVDKLLDAIIRANTVPLSPQRT